MPHPSHSCRPLWLGRGRPPICVLPDHFAKVIAFTYRDDVRRDAQR